MDDSMYPVDSVRPLARALRSAALSWHDTDHRLVEKVAEDMTMQDFIDAAEEQRDRTLREHARGARPHDSRLHEPRWRSRADDTRRTFGPRPSVEGWTSLAGGHHQGRGLSVTV
jgi:hypothetical protein